MPAFLVVFNSLVFCFPHISSILWAEAGEVLANEMQVERINNVFLTFSLFMVILSFLSDTKIGVFWIGKFAKNDFYLINYGKEARMKIGYPAGKT